MVLAEHLLCNKRFKNTYAVSYIKSLGKQFALFTACNLGIINKNNTANPYAMYDMTAYKTAYLMLEMSFNFI